MNSNESLACNPCIVIASANSDVSSSIAIAVLKDKEPGTFLIRDSNSFQGAYGLALKVATPPPNANIIGSKGIQHKSLQIKCTFLLPTYVKTVHISFIKI